MLCIIKMHYTVINQHWLMNFEYHYAFHTVVTNKHWFMQFWLCIIKMHYTIKNNVHN